MPKGIKLINDENIDLAIADILGEKILKVFDVIASGKIPKSAPINVSTSGDNTIVTAVSGKKIKVYAFSIQSVANVDVKFKDGASADLTGPYNFKNREGASLATSIPSSLFETAAGNALVLNLSGAFQVVGVVSYWDDDAT